MILRYLAKAPQIINKHNVYQLDSQILMSYDYDD